MSYRLVSSSSDDYTLLLDGEPGYVHALPMAPTELEPALTQGEWLLLVFAVWSTADMQAIGLAIEFARKRNGELLLGLRPFDRHDELSPWVPMSRLASHDSMTLTERGFGSSKELLITGDRSRNPIWLFFKDGSLIGEAAGTLSYDSLDKLSKGIFEKQNREE